MSLKPPVVPMPFTGGGGNIITMASWMAMNLPLSELAMAAPLSSGDLRSSKLSRPTNTMPALGLMVKPWMDRPGKAMASFTPGSSMAIWDIRRMTSSVRSREAPSGSCAKPTRYCLSWLGTKPSGTVSKPFHVAQTRPP